MSAVAHEKLTNWLRAVPTIRGALLRGIRFADETFVSDIDAREFPATAMDQAWRNISDTFQVLSAQRMPPDRLTWQHEKTSVHCARRPDGAILAIFISRKSPDVDTMALEKMLLEFQSLVAE